MKSPRHTTLATIAAIAVTLALAGLAAAQQRINDGRQLDNNLRRGSGGINEARPSGGYGAYQNALVTGNVGGLARFRGEVDYLAPGEFSDLTGADDTFDFRRTAAPGNVFTRRPGRGDPTGGLLPQAYDNRIILRAGSGVSAGDLSGFNTRLRAGQRDDVTSFQLGQTARNEGISTLSASAIDQGPPPLAVTVDRTGRLLQIQASPLMGVRRVAVGTLGRRTQLDRPTPPGVPPAEFDPTDVAPGAPEGGPDAEGLTPPDAALNAGLRADPAIEARLADLMVAPAEVIGTQLTADESTPDPTGADERAAADTLLLARTMFRRGAEDAEAGGQDVYADLLQRIRKTAAMNAQDQLAALRSPDPADAEQGDPNNRLVSPIKPPAFRTPAEALADQIEQADPDAVTPEAKKQAIEALVNQLDYDLPPMRTLSGVGDTVYDEAMTEAEDAMREGKYFVAEGHYVRAISVRPATPLARVGRTHAQLGAGLYLSAAFNLRRVFTAHPELIAARYEFPLLPDADRLDKIEEDLETMQKESQRDAPVLLRAYIAYQRGDQSQVDHLLSVLATRTPDDPILKLLQRIWREKKDDGGDAEKQPETDPVTPAPDTDTIEK